MYNKSIDTVNYNIDHIQIENEITPSDFISTALCAMLKYRYWSNTTIESYKKDVNVYETFMIKHNEEPSLSNAKLHLVQKWITDQKNEGIAVATIQRRLAALSSIFSFYKELNLANSNPFKIAAVPIGEKGHHSEILNIENLKILWRFLEDLKLRGIDLEATVKVMFFTGLRNSALTSLKVKNVVLEKGVLVYEPEFINSKHKAQLIPLPVKLLHLLESHIQMNNLKPDDTLLVGLRGHPLQSKQLNRVTDFICRELEWNDQERITPHGFRASIATLLSERGIERDSIKFLLGQSEKDNLDHYIRTNNLKISKLRNAFNSIEEELNSSLQHSIQVNEATKFNEEEQHATTTNHHDEFLLRLMEIKPELAIKLIEKKYGLSIS